MKRPKKSSVDQYIAAANDKAARLRGARKPAPPAFDMRNHDIAAVPTSVSAGADLPAAPVAAAVEWLDKSWRWPLDRETLVRGVVSAYQDATNAKR